ncbi:matrixin family metalloprotease [Secundilactobacillus collinoides]|nr:matrixin family metalloprotease [Secundilactobacillus collinoides]
MFDLTRHQIHRSVVAMGLMLCMLIVGGPVTSVTAQAAITPVFPYRFPTSQASIHITAGSYYTKVWQQAIKIWNSKHVFSFKLTSRSSAQVLATSLPSNLYQAELSGLTSIQHTADNRIVAVTAYINTSVVKANHYTTAQRVHVAEHELGHAMGLDHNPGKKSVMYYANRYYAVQTVDVTTVKAHYKTPMVSGPLQGEPVSDTAVKYGTRILPLLNQTVGDEKDIQLITVKQNPGGDA